MYHVFVLLDGHLGKRRPFDQRKRDQRKRKIVPRARTRLPFLSTALPYRWLPRIPKKIIVPKLKKNRIGIRPEYLSYKVTMEALQHLNVQLLYQKTRVVRFLRSFLNLFLEWLSFYDLPFGGVEYFHLCSLKQIKTLNRGNSRHTCVCLRYTYGALMNILRHTYGLLGDYLRCFGST